MKDSKPKATPVLSESRFVERHFNFTDEGIVNKGRKPSKPKKPQSLVPTERELESRQALEALKALQRKNEKILQILEARHGTAGPFGQAILANARNSQAIEERALREYVLRKYGPDLGDF